MIVEIAFDITSADLALLESLFEDNKIAYYIEPPKQNSYKTLDEVEVDCEGK